MPMSRRQRERRAMQIARMGWDDAAQLTNAELDEVAFGWGEGLHALPVEILSIWDKENWEIAKAEVDEDPKRWLPYLDEPIEVELVDDAIWIRDGHHRFYTALLEGRKTVPVDLYIQDNPIRKIMAFAADPRSVALHPRPGTSTLRERLANAF